MPSGRILPARLLLLVNKRLPGITLYGADDYQPIAEAKTGICPHEAAFSRDGRYIFVPVYGSSGVGKPGTDEHVIHVFRTPDCQRLGELDTGDFKRPHGIVVGASGRVYLTAEVASSVIVLDGKPQPQIVGVIPTGSETSHMLSVTRDEQRAYVSNVQSQTVSVLDLSRQELIHTIATEGENQRMTLSPDEKWFVTNLGPASKVAFYRTTDNILDFAVPLDGRPFVSRFSVDGRFLYCAGFAGADRTGAWKIDVSERKVAAQITSGLGTDPGSLEVNPFNGNVLLSDQPSDTVHILDPESWLVARSFSTHGAPDAMDFFPR